MLLEKIKIGGFTVNIKIADNILHDRRELGNYTPRTQTIHLERDSTVQQKEETLVHEILEAIINIYDIEIEHSKLSLIATVLHQVLKDNKICFD